MRPEIFARWLSGFLLLAAALVTPAGMAQAPAPPRTSGKITALVPLDFVLREQKSLDAKKDMPVFWGDTVRRSAGGGFGCSWRTAPSSTSGRSLLCCSSDAMPTP